MLLTTFACLSLLAGSASTPCSLLVLPVPGVGAQYACIGLLAARIPTSPPTLPSASQKARPGR